MQILRRTLYVQAAVWAFAGLSLAIAPEFALVTTAMGAVTLLNIAFGLGPHQAAGLWWLLSAIFVLFALSLLFGLYAASQEQPNPG